VKRRVDPVVVIYVAVLLAGVAIAAWGGR